MCVEELRANRQWSGFFSCKIATSPLIDQRKVGRVFFRELCDASTIDATTTPCVSIYRFIENRIMTGFLLCAQKYVTNFGKSATESIHSPVFQ